MGNEMTFKELLDDFRKRLKTIAADVKAAKEERSKCETTKEEDMGEELANLTLTYRHLEDASMRVGKTIQALSGGKSIYDNNAVGTPEVGECVGRCGIAAGVAGVYNSNPWEAQSSAANSTR